MKPALQPSDSTGLTILFQHPQRVSLLSSLLVSSIDLPTSPLISCSVFTATHASRAAEQLAAVEHARRRLVSENTRVPVVQSILPSVHITKERVSLYVFAFGSTSEASAAQKALAGLQFDALEQTDSYAFTPDGIYPCSPSCAAQLAPCFICTQSGQTSLPIASSSRSPSVCSLPRKPLRLPLAQFIQALRDRIIDDVARSSGEISKRRAVRLREGFLLSPLSPHDTSEWGAGWDHYGQLRSFIHCELQVTMAPTRLIIQPILRSTQYFPLPISLPLATGTPVVLLPYGTPAFYLNKYTGTIGNLTRQFEDALLGLGAGKWKDVWTNEATHCPSYLIAWVSVQNKQGEEKGLPVIWPASLSVLPGASSPQARHKLHCLPDLPPHLLASPPAMPTQAPPLDHPPSALSLSPLSSPTASDSYSSPRMTCREQLTTTFRNPRPLLSSRLMATDSLRAFRSLTIGGKNLHVVARDVSTYVDSVAKEREKERERLKREREGSSSRVSVSPQKPESSQSPTVHLVQDQGVSSTATRYESPFATLDQGMPKREEPPVAFTPWDTIQNASTGVMVDSLPPLDMATSQVIPPGPDPAEPTNAVPDTGGLPAEDVPIAVDDDLSKDFAVFNGFDASWPQTSADLIGIDMSLDHYNFGIDIGGANNDETAKISVDDGFELFTDDDFDFFDRPQPNTSQSSRPSNLLLATVATGTPSSTAFRGSQTSGPGPPVSFGSEQQAPWPAHLGFEGLTPHSLPASTPGLLSAPEYNPSTPIQTPLIQSGPATPAVMLDHHIHARRGSGSSQGSVGFEPIPFSPAHKATDGKYTVGKFALPTPPPEDVERVWPMPRRQEHSTPPVGWRFSYSSVTDPRIAVVRRLVGAKRKRSADGESHRSERMSPAWLREYEEWAASPSVQDGLDGDSKTDSDLDAEEDADDEELSSMTPSRSFTPPISHLPLGPSLLATMFHHSYVLTLSTALRSPGAVAMHGHAEVGAGPISVPTPVSPAATLGTAAEHAKPLETAAQFLIRELVENPTWADAWRANLVTHCSSHVEPDIWPDDIHHVVSTLKDIPGVRTPLELSVLCDPNSNASFRELDPPLLVVGKSDALMQVLPSALRFWEKLGLKPRGGSKDVIAFMFFEAKDEARETELGSWLESLGQTYAAKNYGTHSLGRAAGCTRDGLVPVLFDTFRKTLVSFVQSLPPVGKPVVFYIVVPTYMISLASGPLRQIFSAMRRAKKAQPDASLLFHLVPEPLTSGNVENPAMRHLGFEIMADTIYDRVLTVTQRMLSQAQIADGERTQALFQEPAFVLARPLLKKPTFRLEARVKSLDVMDRFSVFHVGYRVSPCRRWLFAACVDQRGEMHELKAWVLQDDNSEKFVVRSIWALAVNVAARANVEWRIAITKHGTMNALELEAWGDQLSFAERHWMTAERHVSSGELALPPSQVLVLVADHERPWTFMPPEHTGTQKPPKSPYRVHKQSPGTVMHEISAASFLVQPESPSPVILDPPQPLPLSHPFIPEVEGEDAPPSCMVRPLASATLIRVPAASDYTSSSMLHLHLLDRIHPTAQPSTSLTDRETLKDIAQNYHDLAILARHRWKLNANPILPFHLAALEVVCTALSCEESFADS